ncbi:XrtA/PEP-CTERM system histidine kinase PrsK [Candidatus Berkiella aquae]|uniref:histidine kinase n=1 Tax=Candidatus Berkiella aquae TaxID=295108 RepID=A0A0Q9YP38_9GAMM|nr:XrtA/PEP-CTERM system histidine kinase PrsK [Candidatus Berkiella aquae]MCS5712060.1 PEP-CTERM system histidine kinase PrsK [Candidatus Berkiella aquae]
MPEIAVASYLSCAIAFALVTFALLLHRPTRLQFPILALCTFTTVIWGLLATVYAAGFIANYAWVTASEIINNALWLICLIKLLKITQQTNRDRWYFRHSFYYVVSFLVLSLFTILVIENLDWQIPFQTQLDTYSYCALVLFSLLMLALIEQIYRGSIGHQRWRIKFLCISLGIVYCYDFYMYANAAILNNISISIWQMRGAISTLVAPLIVLSALRHHKWQPEIFPSRTVIFRSTIFISGGIYLLAMETASCFIKEWGGSWGDALQILFFTGSLVLLAMMLSSGRARAWTKVFIAKNFFKLRYDYREEWIRFSLLLYANDDERQLSTRVIKALADMVESRKGVLFEWEEKRGFVLKGCWHSAFPNQEVVIEPCPFTDYLQQSQRALEIPSHTSDSDRAFSFVNVPPAIRQFSWAWLLVPLLHGNRLHAFVILAHPRVAFFNVNWEVLDLLSMAGRQAVICLVQEQNAQALAVARQFEGFNRLSAFVMHDLKNVQSQLKLVSSNREKHENNPAFVRSAFQTIDHATDKIDRLLLQMRDRGKLLGSQTIHIAQALQKVIQLTNHRHPIPRMDWQIVSNDIQVLGNEDQFVNILCHLVENAQQATAEHGEVTLSVMLNDGKLSIAIRDSGCGMEAEFLHGDLYKPFITTKGEKGMGIGVYEAKEYVNHVGGKLSVETEKNKGSTFTLEFPLVVRNGPSTLQDAEIA